VGLQDANTPAESSGKPQIRGIGAAKSAADSGGSAVGTVADAGREHVREASSPTGADDAGAAGGGGPEHAATSSSPGAGTADAGGGPGGSLVAALAMLERLPLTDAERADAVRRLLADAAGGAR
jgi:hypothetical protein